MLTITLIAALVDLRQRFGLERVARDRAGKILDCVIYEIRPINSIIEKNTRY